MAAVSANRVLIYGGRGALGSTCVHHFKSQGWWVANIDIGANEEADANVHVKICDNFCEHAEQVTSDVAQLLGDQKVDAIVCVAGGWAGATVPPKVQDVFKSSDLMWKQSVWTSTISTYLASHHLKPGGLLTLTGAKASLSGTPGMVGYGMAKAAVHQLCESVAGQNSGLPAGAVAVAILPVTLDTPMNRKFMPNADFSSWTPLEYIAEQGEKCSMGKIYGFGHKVAVMFFQRLMFYSWATGSERPASGSLIQLVTSGGKTEATPVQ